MIFLSWNMIGQTKVEGYAFESGNRGFLKDIRVTLTNISTEESTKAITDENGKYVFEIEVGNDYRVKLENDLFISTEIEFKEDQITEGETVFLSHEMKREPGYIFEITLAEKNREPDAPKDQMKGALVEVFNNTKEEEELIIDGLTVPDFKVNLKKGNHYTVMVRHPEFLTKRMEAYVDVEGCILCFEGIGDVRPGVSDNLTEGNTQGTLLANVELERYFDGKVISLSNIYYDLDDSRITSKAAAELDKVAVFINDNPNIEIELSSHTDSRGQAKYNQKLSQQRSESAVGYLLDRGKVNPNQMTAQGYGESELLNECEDGVKCSEDKHKINRRTELKLLKIESRESYKPLAELKREERFEQMLKELEFGGDQVRISTEDDLPPGVRNNSESEIENTSEKNEEDEMVTESTENVQSELSDLESGSIETESDLSLHDVSDYTGYRLVIHFSRFSLPETHELFANNEEVLDYVTKDNNHLYMIGEYNSRKKALKELKEKVQVKYPNAYLVGFMDGIRIE